MVKPKHASFWLAPLFAEDLGLGGGLVGGLLGRAAGAVLRSAVKGLGEQMRQAQEQVADVQDRAARIIESSSKLRQALGGSVQAMPPVSQSSMSQSINGRMTKTVTLLLPVAGANGTAQVFGGAGGHALHCIAGLNAAPLWKLWQLLLHLLSAQSTR